MPTASRPIESLRTDWQAIARSADSRSAMVALAEREPTIAALGLFDLGDLLGHLANPATRSSGYLLITAMLRSARAHPLIARTILQALIPGLVATARRLDWGAGAYDEPSVFLVDMVAEAYEVIVEWQGEDRAFAAGDLLGAVRCRMRRRILAEVKARRCLADRLPEPVAPLPARELAAADIEAAAAVMGVAESAALYGCLVLGISIRELARVSGTSRRHVERLVRRGERAMCA